MKNDPIHDLNFYVQVFLTFKITLRNILNLKLHCTAVPNIIGIM